MTTAVSSRLHLIADDLTGALDSAARFVGRCGPVAARWHDLTGRAAGNIAVDTGSREADGATAGRCTADALAALAGHAPALAFAKLDSLLRGHPAEEIAAWCAARPFAQVVIAPAFPAQGRVTRGGRQYVLTGAGAAQVTGADLAAALARLGRAVTLCRPGDALPGGVSLWDAEDDEDLQQIVATAEAADGPILWGGSAGLAGALAGMVPPSGFDGRGGLPLPLLLLVGTNHPVTLGQLAVVGKQAIAYQGAVEPVAARLAEAPVAVVTMPLPPATTRAAAQERIVGAYADLLHRLNPRPAALGVIGGETLRGLCEACAVEAIEVIGQLRPGLPCGRLVGGPLDGLALLSRSGAFGRPDFFSRLIADPLLFARKPL